MGFLDFFLDGRFCLGFYRQNVVEGGSQEVVEFWLFGFIFQFQCLDWFFCLVWEEREGFVLEVGKGK